MNVQLTAIQFWALVAGGPITLVLTVMAGILVNNAIPGAKVAVLERGLQGRWRVSKGR